ncbi:MAG TPA: O-antigen ligase family protein [Thermoanaerobaculia bacterium]|nr:O-antigen ligase family protein [Thermoanaerobaculia bacterium]
MALRVLQIGAIAVVLVATVHPSFDLDRFLVPKELVLHVTALIAGALTWRFRQLARADYALLGFLLLSALSLAAATNPWLAFRALALSVSSYVIFRAARAVPAEPLLNALALAVVLAAVTALLQAYGIWLPFFTENRAPGGTLGNRNFVGHAAAFGLPLVLLAAMRGRRLAPFGVAIVTAALILTRSRAAWIAAAAVALIFVAGMIWRARMWRRLGLVALFAIAGAVAALLLPNTLRWRSDNPYLDSVKGVTAYEQGSGRGRLVQYQRSLRMAAANPIVGVGAGNWAVEYPEFAGRSDPSLDDNEAGMTTNPWPSSDWIAYVSERGFIATLLLGLALLAIAWQRSDDALYDITRVATLAGAITTGALDAVLLLAAPALIVWAALGALQVERRASARREDEPPPRPQPLATFALALLLVVTFTAVVRSASQWAAIEVSKSDTARAAAIDPFNYRLRMRLARGGRRKSRCEHARAAHALFPNAVAARNLAAGCD